MNQSAIFGPFLAMMMLTLAVWTYMYARRIAFIRARNVRPQELATPAALAAISPAAVASPSDNLKNLFELPVIFYAVVLYLFATGQVDALHVTAAWVFAAFRALHSAVHCTVNIVLVRFGLYLIASLALWLMVLRAAASMLAA